MDLRPLRRLILLPPALCAVYVVAVALTPSGTWMNILHHVAQALILLVTASSGLLAAGVFARGDMLRRAWLSGVIGYALAGVGAAATPLRGEDWPGVVVAGAAITVLFANLVAFYGLTVFARAYRKAGLDIAASPHEHLVVRVAALVLAGVVCGAPLARSIASAAAGDDSAIVAAVASAGDLVIFQILVRIFMTARALRGGLLVWPWAYLLASDLAWFLVDAQPIVPDLFPRAGPLFVACWPDFWLYFACGLTIAASLSQRRISCAA